nr:MAG TPA: hypothetical protein [Caudoviricetes sp.]
MVWKTSSVQQARLYQCISVEVNNLSKIMAFISRLIRNIIE